MSRSIKIPDHILAEWKYIQDIAGERGIGLDVSDVDIFNAYFLITGLDDALGEMSVRSEAVPYYMFKNTWVD